MTKKNETSDDTKQSSTTQHKGTHDTIVQKENISYG
jgi:hypothetical protein